MLPQKKNISFCSALWRKVFNFMLLKCVNELLFRLPEIITITTTK